MCVGNKNIEGIFKRFGICAGANGFGGSATWAANRWGAKRGAWAATCPAAPAAAHGANAGNPQTRRCDLTQNPALN